MGDSAPQYWFCLRHKTVEGEDGCRNADRLGPYASSSEAEQALDKVEARNEAWDNDPAWNDEDEWPEDRDGEAGAADGSGPTP